MRVDNDALDVAVRELVLAVQAFTLNRRAPDYSSNLCPPKWETDFYTPPVLGGAALLPFSAPAVYKNPVP